MKGATILKSVTALATMAALSAAPGTALASRLTTSQDGFEPPNGQWYFDGEGDGTGTLFNNASLAHSGAWGAFLWTFGSSWQSVGRPFTITGWTSANKGRCSTQFFVRSESVYYTTLNVEIIDQVTWTYVKLQHEGVSTSSGWTTVEVDDWVPPRNQVFIRISAGAALDFEPYKQDMILFVDDMTTSCFFR